MDIITSFDLAIPNVVVGIKEKRKQSPPKLDQLGIHRESGSESSPQAKVIILEETSSQSTEIKHQQSLTIVLK